MVNNVNHKNMIVMWNFLKGFAKKEGLNEEDVNIFAMLGLPFPEKYSNPLSYYTDPTQWSPLEVYVQCYLKARDVTGNPNAFRACGRSAAKYKSWGNWRELVKSLSGPSAAINILPNIIPDWNDTKTFELIEPAKFDLAERKVKAIIKYTFHPHIVPSDDYCSDPHILGLLEAIPTNWPKHLWKPWVTLPLGKIQQPLVQYDPIKLFSSRYFNHLDLMPAFDGNSLCIRHPIKNKLCEIGEKVILIPTEVNGKEVFLGKYKAIHDPVSENDFIGTLILETIEVNGETVCEEGVIMEAPYFIIKHSCEELRITQRFWIFRNFFRGRSALWQEYFQANKALHEEIEEKNKAYKKLEDYADHLEDMVEERTQELRETQAKLVETEKRSLEHRITGGFAHEMRNALSGAQLEFRTTLNYKDKGKPSAEVLKDSATSLLKNINQIHEKYNIPREEIASNLVPELKTIAEIADHLSGVHSGVSSDLDRGLSITTQIRDYAKMSELKRGYDKVDVMALLRGYKDRYLREFDSYNIKYLVDGPEKVVISTDEIHMNSIFTNLINNARDALIEQDSESKEIRVVVEKVDEEGNKNVRIKVQDNGPGIPQNQLDEIFEPFFSTKPTSGTGLGLGIVKRLVQVYGGQIEVESGMEEGTTFTITLPENHNG